MRFRLLYSGRLLGANKNNTRAKHKAQIRKEFSPQLERLIQPKANLYRACSRSGYKWFEDHPEDRYKFEGLSDDAIRSLLFDSWRRYMPEEWRRGNQSFIPLVTDKMDIRCGLDILFLRPEEPGMIVGGADLDNRLKSLLDALRVPDTDDGFESEDAPIFCLLEDDKLVSEIKVAADQLLLLPKEASLNPNDVFLVVNVDIESPPSNIWHQAFA